MAWILFKETAAWQPPAVMETSQQPSSLTRQGLMCVRSLWKQNHWSNCSFMFNVLERQEVFARHKQMRRWGAVTWCGNWWPGMSACWNIIQTTRLRLKSKSVSDTFSRSQTRHCFLSIAGGRVWQSVNFTNCLSMTEPYSYLWWRQRRGRSTGQRNLVCDTFSSSVDRQ